MITHKPMRPLYDVARHGALIGYKCGHCGSLFTENGRPSVPHRLIETNPGVQGRFVKSKKHARRVQAARADRFRARLEKAKVGAA